MSQAFLANLGRAAALCLMAALAARAQEAAPAPPRPAPDKLVVQVEYMKGAKPAFQDVPGSAWYAAFGSTPAAAARAANETVHAVDVKATLEGERVELKVGVHVGGRFFDRLDSVATYTLAPGEAVEARDLERVGVRPFVFKVLRVSASDTAAPAVDNRTQSIAAAVTAFKPDPLPRAKITLTNLSAKRVRAVAMQTVVDGRRRTSIFAFEREGRPLMEPGGTYERNVGITDGSTAGTGFTPISVEGVIVLAVVFDDYTFEGDAESAARKACMDEGERLQLPRLLRLVRGAQDAGDGETAVAVRRLREGLAALEDVAPQASVDAMLAAYAAPAPGYARHVREGIEVTMNIVRTGLLNDLERFEKQHKAAPAADGFKRWLAEQQARLDAWLARL